MPSVVVLGMHRSGTSLVASMLDAIGVDMGVGEGAIGRGDHPSQPNGHWEDSVFANVSENILVDHGATWDDPPDGLDWRKFRPEVAMLVSMREHPELRGEDPRHDGEWWGWKDPRACITAACFHRYLEDPHYVAVDRSPDKIIDSLNWREGEDREHWERLIHTYMSYREEFLSAISSPLLRVRFEDLVDPMTSWEACKGLVEFLGMDRERVEWLTSKAVGRIDARPGQPGRSGEWPRELAAVLSHAKEKADRRFTVAVLGEESATLKSLLLGFDPSMRYVPVSQEWAGEWKIPGPINALFIVSEVGGLDTLRWIAKVRPGGFVALQKKLGGVHDWPDSTWENKLLSRFGWSVFQRRPFLRAGDHFGTLGVGVPFFKADYNFFRWWSNLLLRGLRNGDEFLNDETVLAPLPIPVVHNRLMARFLESDRDTFLIVEDDHCGDPPNLIDWEIVERMRVKAENFDFDIVTANYVNRRADPGIVGYRLAARPNRYGESLCILEYGDVWKSGTQPVDGSVFGLAFIRRWVLDAMLAYGNPKTAYWCEWKGANSQDVNFYAKARDGTGCRVGVDRDANIGHAMYSVRSVKDFWDHMEGKDGS